MHFVNSILLAAGSASLVTAHTAFTNFFVDGVNQGDGTAVRMSNINSKATNPIAGVTSPDVACGVNGENGVSRVANAKAGSTITFEWRDWPDGSQPGSIDISHKGPCAVYMKNVQDATASHNAAGDGWFKIMEDGYDETTQKWCTERLIPNNGHLQATIPNDLPAGYYLMRPELLALHQADKTPPDPQFYVGCAQIFLASGGNAKPPHTVTIPGYVNMKTPAMTYNIWKVPLSLPFPDFGPPVYTAGSTTKRSSVKLNARSVMVQKIGLKPDSCVMQNANWCAYTPPTYTDQNGCWASSKNCSAQTSTCYSSAGPTGSKNCHNWEAYCTDIRTACGAGNYQGPPAPDAHMPAPLAKLSSGVVTEEKMKAADTTPAVQTTSADTATTSKESGSGSGSGSTDTCGINGGLTCASGYCCSSHGYCGTTAEYCDAGCDVKYGTCKSASTMRMMKKRNNAGH